MFCSKCGKTIDDNATFCGFCGAPANNAAETVTNGTPQGVPQPTPTPTQNNVPQYGAPQNNASQFGAPQNSAPQFGAPQFGAPQTSAGGFSLNLAPNVVEMINKILRGVLALLAVMILIGSIGPMASIGAVKNTSSMSSGLSALKGLIAFVNLARVPAIISFILALAGAVFAYLTKQRSLFAYIAAGAGVIMFIFNFFLAKFSNILAMISVTESSFGVATVGSVFLLLSAVVMIACSVIILMKKEDVINFKPKF